MPFIRIMPLSYYILNDRLQDLEILKRHNIHITAPELKIEDFLDPNFDDDEVNYLLETLFD